ncbi:hypothetical protein PIB30_104882, partial [Stylosanthes scabra]|nr:hypothetical protein [Stylosanthes scabra]
MEFENGLHVIRVAPTYNVEPLQKIIREGQNCPHYTWGSSRITWALCDFFKFLTLYVVLP